MKKIFFYYSIILLLFSCDFNYDFNNSDTEEDSATIITRYDHDLENDTIKYYENEIHKWTEYYDYNEDGKLIFKVRKLPSGTILWSNIYHWQGENIIGEAYYSSTNELSWFKIINYSNSNVSKEITYKSDSTITNIKTFIYYNDIVTEAASYSGINTLSWVYKNDYESDLLKKSSYYNDDALLTACIEYSYFDNLVDISSKKGFGESTYSSAYITNPTSYSFPESGGINASSRNTENLEFPNLPSDIEPASYTLTDTKLDYSWLSTWIYDDFGYQQINLDSNYKPVYIKRVADDYLGEKALTVDLKYESNSLASKVLKHGDTTLLSLGFTYNNELLIQLETSGELLLMPITYKITYSENDLPESIKIINNDTTIQKFEYVYSETEVDKIKHYDGNNTLLGYYQFSYEDESIIMSSYKTDDEYNGKFVLEYNVDGKKASFISYSSEDEEVWSYEYGYDDLGNMVTEDFLNEDGDLSIITDFNIETLFCDLL